MNNIDYIHTLTPFFIGIILCIPSKKKHVVLLKSIIILKIISHVIDNRYNSNHMNYIYNSIEVFLFIIIVIIIIIYMRSNKIHTSLFDIYVLYIAFIFLAYGFILKNKLCDIIWHIFITLFLLRIY